MTHAELHTRILRRRTLALVLAGLLVAAAALPAAAQKDYQKLRYPPLADLKLPKVERFELANGLVVYLVEDHTLPKVEGYALVKTGDRFEPADKVGLAGIVGRVMRTGGSTSRKGEDIDRLLENMGASVETSIDNDSGNASLFTLKENLPQVLEVLADLLRNPAFPQDKLELAQVQERSAIARRNDDVGEIAGREFAKLLYGASSPYARQTEYATIQNVTRDDLVAFHRRYFQPNHTILGLWGDFNAAEVKGLVEQKFGSWPPAASGPALALPEVPKEWKGSINFIAKDDVNQTNVRLGHLGGRLDDPDYYALNVMSEILGGGLSSRLFRHIRSDLGLAYAAGSAWAAEYDHPGFFLIRVDTKSQTTVQAIAETLKEVKRLTAEPVSAEELRAAKEGILNSFVFNFDTTGEIVRRLMTYEYFGYPRDFLEKFKANVEKVTAEDVLRAAQAHLKPDQLVILAVGRQQDFDKPLASLGAVNTIDITIPEAKAEAAAVPAATPESLAHGRAVLEAAIKGMGGLAALKGVRDLTILSRILQTTPQGDFQLTGKLFLALPSKFRQDVVTPFGELSLIFDGEHGWQKSPQGTRSAPPPFLDSMRKSAARNLLRLLPEAEEGKRTAQFLETTSLDGHDADVVLVTDESGDTVKLYVEKGTGNVLKQAFQGMAPGQGPVTEEQVYSDFRAVGGVMFPYKVVIFQGGKKAQERTVDDIEVNTGLDPKLFTVEEPPKPQN